jgi:Homeodomain
MAGYSWWPDPYWAFLGKYGDSRTVSQARLSTFGHDHQSNAAQKRFTQDQQLFLEGEFQKENKPTTARKREYANQLGCTVERVNVGPIRRVLCAVLTM